MSKAITLLLVGNTILLFAGEIRLSALKTKQGTSNHSTKHENNKDEHSQVKTLNYRNNGKSIVNADPLPG